MTRADVDEREDQKDRYIRTAFLERVAHELRGPAGVIQGALQELELALGAEAEAHRSLLDMARRGVQRVVRTADRLQQTGQCERGGVPLQRASCDVAELLRKSVVDAERLEARKKILVHLELPQSPLLHEVDARWLSVALYEVASNAIRHAKERVEVQLLVKDGALEMLFLDDSGAAVMFEPLRFEAPRESRGLGLALAIVRDVIEAHGGQLEIDVGDGLARRRGSEVRIRLPQAEKAPAQAGV